MLLREYLLWYVYKCVCEKKGQIADIYKANIIRFPFIFYFEELKNSNSMFSEILQSGCVKLSYNAKIIAQDHHIYKISNMKRADNIHKLDIGK